MKHTLFTLLTALAAVPSFAGNLNESDWIISGSDPSMVTFNQDGTLTMTGIGTTDNPYPFASLVYSPSNTYKMENGSSLSITLQLNTQFNEHEAHFTLFLESGNDDVFTNFGVSKYAPEYGFYVGDVCNGEENNFMSYEDNRLLNQSKITINYTVENGGLYCSHTLNNVNCGKVTVMENIDTESYWLPKMEIFDCKDTTFTITNFTITSVPEPATSTLSLLALCGLAARRRRK